jgi:aspartyl-tRNA(Asn)/glutamyl-tRNA(Gln) amidotransferase subunit B
MQEGSFRCDANVSVRLAGDAKLGTRCEIKNLNSFRFIQQAIEFEVRRQIELIEDGGTMVQETRLYDPDRNETRSMRSKEDAQDYRYFPDPDLPPLVIDGTWIERIRAEMPELPESMAHRFVDDYGVPMPDAVQLTASREIARYFESTVQAPVGVDLSGKTAANWILGEITARLNRDGIEIEQAPVRPKEFAQLLARFQDNTISGSTAKEVLDTMWNGEIGGDADAIIAAKGLRQISDSGAIEKLVDDVIAANPAIVAEYQAGKAKAFNSLVGKAMAATNGKANPAQVNAILKRKLAG